MNGKVLIYLTKINYRKIPIFLTNVCGKENIVRESNFQSIIFIFIALLSTPKSRFLEAVWYQHNSRTNCRVKHRLSISNVNHVKINANWNFKQRSNLQWFMMWSLVSEIDNWISTHSWIIFTNIGLSVVESKWSLLNFSHFA